MATVKGHGGELALVALEQFGVSEMFTLSGAHIFPLYDAALKVGMKLYDVRHEQTATFAAEGMAKLTRRPGLSAITAGPGVTNGVSAITTAHFNGSPLIVFGGRAAQEGWGRGALQEFDHLPVVESITKRAVTVPDTESTISQVHAAAREAISPHRGPVFVDFPMDVLFGAAEAQRPPSESPASSEPDHDEVARAAGLLARAEKPAVVVGTDLYWEGAWEQLLAAVEALRLPTFVNGLGRGCIPADHELAFSRTRRMLKSDADVVAVIGTPLDFRLSFGSFGDAEVIHIVDSPDSRAGHVTPAASPAGNIGATLSGLADYAGELSDHDPWIGLLRDLESAARADDEKLLRAEADPIKPTRVYGELRQRLDPDAVIVCDGGDFVSYGGKYLDSYRPGLWLDPGPYGCLGTGMGYAMAARVAHPDKQVCVLLGDGAAGFSLMDADSLVRHELPVVIVVGNNGIWGLEKHPMQLLYGYDVAADLQPGCRYDHIVSALGGAGETVETPAEIGPALDRAFASGVPYLVNVITDPGDAYPRSSSLI